MAHWTGADCRIAALPPPGTLRLPTNPSCNSGTAERAVAGAAFAVAPLSRLCGTEIDLADLISPAREP